MSIRRYTTSRSAAFGAVAWAAANRGLSKQAVQRPAGFFTARSQVETFARVQRPFVVAGAFDRSAIMAAAVAAAKSHQGAYGSTWTVAMSVSLKAAWQTARLARHVTKH